jgi:hypothetical protein
LNFFQIQKSNSVFSLMPGLISYKTIVTIWFIQWSNYHNQQFCSPANIRRNITFLMKLKFSKFKSNSSAATSRLEPYNHISVYLHLIPLRLYIMSFHDQVFWLLEPHLKTSIFFIFFSKIFSFSLIYPGLMHLLSAKYTWNMFQKYTINCYVLKKTKSCFCLLSNPDLAGILELKIS